MQNEHKHEEVSQEKQQKKLSLEELYELAYGKKRRDKEIFDNSFVSENASDGYHNYDDDDADCFID